MSLLQKKIYLFLFFFFFLGSVFSLVSYQKAQKDPEFDEQIVPPLGLPSIPWPKNNPYTKKKAELGKLLYFDKRLSADGSVSCATCHNKPCGFSDCKEVAEGIFHKKGTRHSPTIINSAYLKHLFWDGRVASLEEQAMGPIANPKEMSDIDDSHEAHYRCQERVGKIPGYQILFKEAFGSDEVTMEQIAQAIATFERTVLSGNSAFDRYHAGDHSAMTQQEIEGFKIFKRVGCINCHGGFNFDDDRFLNIGIGMDAPDPDLGRYVISKAEKDWGAFKVPTLRDCAQTSPYMHNGKYNTLEEVIDYYDTGGIPNKNLHPLMRPLHLTSAEKNALVSFLKALNGKGWQKVMEPSEFPK